MRRTVRDLALCTGVVAMFATNTSAQQPVPAPTEKWEVAVTFGGVISTNPSSGTFTLPAVDHSLPLATGGSGPRMSSWFFADGAKLLNDVNAQLGIGVRVTPLDDVLGSSMIQTPNTLAVGFRVARVLTSRLTAELTLDYSPTGTRARDSVAGALVRDPDYLRERHAAADRSGAEYQPLAVYDQQRRSARNRWATSDHRRVEGSR